MVVRPSWEGHLRLSLVTCPVALYPATTKAETIRFNLINPETNNRIKMKTVDAGTGEEVSRGDLVKGFEIAKGEYVLFDKEELDAVKLESTRIIDIEKFVPRASIDRLYWDTPYHLVPMGKTGIEAYAVIRAAMAKQNKVAIGRLVMSTRERICAIEIEEGALVLGLRVRDLTGGFKCFRREVLEAIHFDGVRSRGYAFQVELTYRAVRAGFRVVEVPIVFRDRQQGQSKMSWRIAAEAMWLVPRLRFR